MKMRVFLPVLLLIFLCTACSKDRRTSRRLDGEWYAEIYNGFEPTQSESYHFTFNDLSDGTGNGVMTYSSTTNAMPQTFALEYFVKKGKLVIVVGQSPDVYTVVDQRRRKIKLLDTYGRTTLLIRM